MRPLIITNAVNHFIRRSRVIYFIEISATAESNGFIISLLLVEQIVTALIIENFQRVVVAICDNEFI